MIESVTADGQTYDIAGDVHLPKHANAIRVDYTSAVLSIPSRAQFRYRLLGFDPNWQTVGGRRQAFYTNLPPGKYHFELQASNEDGVWSDKTASASIVVTPTFWQTPWFTALWISAIAVLLIVLYVARIRQIEVRVFWQMNITSYVIGLTIGRDRFDHWSRRVSIFFYMRRIDPNNST